MPKSFGLRLGYLGSAALIALLGAGVSARADQYKFGDVSISLDTNLSVGASMRVADRNLKQVSGSNGGPINLQGSDPGSNNLGAFTGLTGPGTSLACLTSGNPGLCAATGGSFQTTNNPYAYGGSINGDDGRLNYTSGDVIGAPIKATHELVVQYDNYTVFVRGTEFYDFALSDPNHGDRSLETDKALGLVGRDARLLDAFISADYKFFDMPANLRIGKQVINWGESTFLLNGINVFNPIDVGAFRRPGSEIKEALLPVNAIEGSITLPEELLNISLSGYYALGWDRFHLDPAGSPFSNTDVVDTGSGFGGNQNAASFLSGGRFSGYKINCGSLADQTPGGLSNFAIANNILPTATGHYYMGGTFTDVAGVNASAALRPNCTTFASSNFDYAVPVTIGFAEQQRIARRDVMATAGLSGAASAYEGIVDRGHDLYPSETGDYGLSAKYLAQGDGWLGGYEFGAYYQNYSSRLPFVNETTGELQVGLITSSNSANTATLASSSDVANNLASRWVTPAGCAGLAGTDVRIAQFAGRAMSDPQNLLNANAMIGAAAILGGGSLPANILAGGAGFIDRTNGQTLAWDLTHDNTGAGVAFGSPTAVVHAVSATTFASQYGQGQFNSLTNMVSANCALAAVQSGLVGTFPLPVTFNGSEFFNGYNQLGLSLSYPEGIEQYGFSFSGTIGTWGVQGEFSFRPDAPFQADTDQVTIAAVTQECAFVSGGSFAGKVFEEKNTMPYRCDPNHPGNGFIDGVIHNEMFTGQIGSTATFTSSEWFVDAIGGDLAVFVPEVGVIHVPGVENTWVDNQVSTKSIATGIGPVAAYTGAVQYGNTGCNGSDLPLGSLLGLDKKRSKECRPTDTSAGLVLLANVQYNNAFDTGFVVTPQVAFSWDFYGTTPAPYGNYLDGRMAVNLGVSGSLNNNLKVGVSYTNYFGAGIRNKASDQDFVSASFGYSF